MHFLKFKLLLTKCHLFKMLCHTHAAKKEMWVEWSLVQCKSTFWTLPKTLCNTTLYCHYHWQIFLPLPIDQPIFAVTFFLAFNWLYQMCVYENDGFDLHIQKSLHRPIYDQSVLWMIVWPVVILFCSMLGFSGELPAHILFVFVSLFSVRGHGYMCIFKDHLCSCSKVAEHSSTISGSKQ